MFDCSAGHSGEHMYAQNVLPVVDSYWLPYSCDVIPHLCGAPCSLQTRRGCQGTCTKVIPLETMTILYPNLSSNLGCKPHWRSTHVFGSKTCLRRGKVAFFLTIIYLLNRSNTAMWPQEGIHRARILHLYRNMRYFMEWRTWDPCLWSEYVMSYSVPAL